MLNWWCTDKQTNRISTYRVDPSGRRGRVKIIVVVHMSLVAVRWRQSSASSWNSRDSKTPHHLCCSHRALSWIGPKYHFQIDIWNPFKLALIWILTLCEQLKFCDSKSPNHLLLLRALSWIGQKKSSSNWHLGFFQFDIVRAAEILVTQRVLTTCWLLAQSSLTFAN